MPGLRERREDIAPNIDFEMEQYAQQEGRHVRFAKEAQEQFLGFATASDAAWTGNFRDLNAAIVRMATLSGDGVISTAVVKQEIGRLQQAWRGQGYKAVEAKRHIVPEETWLSLDYFDQMQLKSVLKVCKASRSLSEAGRTLFDQSRNQKKTHNDSDRLRKYLAKFGLTWQMIHGE